MKKMIALLLIIGFTSVTAKAHARGFAIYPMGGYLFYLGGNQQKLDGAPIVGVRLEYNFSRENVMAMGLIYEYTRQHIKNFTDSAALEQHFCLLGYRYARNWRWFNTGVHVGTGAVVREETGSPFEGTDAQYTVQAGLNASFRPLDWIDIGPDFTFMMSTNLNKWIFGGDISYFFAVGGHVAFYF